MRQKDFRTIVGLIIGLLVGYVLGWWINTGWFDSIIAAGLLLWLVGAFVGSALLVVAWLFSRA